MNDYYSIIANFFFLSHFPQFQVLVISWRSNGFIMRMEATSLSSTRARVLSALSFQR